MAHHLSTREEGGNGCANGPLKLQIRIGLPFHCYKTITTAHKAKPLHQPPLLLDRLLRPLLLALAVSWDPAAREEETEMDTADDNEAWRPEGTASYPCTPRTASAAAGRKGRAVVAKGLQKTLSKTSMLVNFLPTGTLLTFEMLLPSVSGDGSCSPVSTTMIHALLGLCAASCFLFHFTDSFRGADGRVYYGFVTPRGLALFKTGLGVEVPKDERYKMGFVDLVHALMAVMVFAAIALSDHRVTNCLFPAHEKEMDEVMESFPLMVGVVCSGLFLVFPNTRYGIGCMAA